MHAHAEPNRYANTPMPPPQQLLRGRRILIVEDNWMIAEEVAATIRDAGGDVLGPYPTMIDALESLTELNAIDGAVLDIGLGEDVSYPLAEALMITRVPFLFLTGVERHKLPERFRQVAHMLKPFSPGLLVQRLLDIGVGAH